MNSLSINERERAYEDVHGVAPDDLPPETSELLERCFQEFENGHCIHLDQESE